MATAIFLSRKSQSIFDICICIYGSLDYLGQLMTQNNIGIDDPITPGTAFVYDSSFTPNNTYIGTATGIYDLSRFQPETIAFYKAIDELLTNPEELELYQLLALDRFIMDLKGMPNELYTTHNIWPLFNVIYPMVGATAGAHSMNLINPQPTTSAFYITWHNNPVHYPNGVYINEVTGGTAYGDTNLSPAAVLTQNAKHYSFFSRADDATNPGPMIGTDNTGGIFDALRTDPPTSVVFYAGTGTNALTTITCHTDLGFFLADRTSSTHMNMQFGSTWGIVTQTATGNPTSNVWLGKDYSGTGSKYCEFASIGNTLGSTNSLFLNQAVQNFRANLGG